MRTVAVSHNWYSFPPCSGTAVPTVFGVLPNISCRDRGRMCEVWLGLVRMKSELGHSLTGISKTPYALEKQFIPEALEKWTFFQRAPEGSCNNGSHRWAVHYIITVYTELQEHGKRGSFLPTCSTNKSNHLIRYHRDVKHEPGRHLNRPYTFFTK